jgi:hypothetical protein
MKKVVLIFFLAVLGSSLDSADASGKRRCRRTRCTGPASSRSIARRSVTAVKPSIPAPHRSAREANDDDDYINWLLNAQKRSIREEALELRGFEGATPSS